MKSRWRNQDGYTIVEMVIVMFMLTAVMAAVLPWFYTNLNQTVRVQGRLDSIEEGRATLRQMSRELRQANSLVNVVERPSGKNSISFTADLDGNGTINSCTDVSVPPECITYVVQGSKLFRGRKNDSGNLIAANLKEMTFQYFGNTLTLDTNGDGLVSGGELGPDGDGDGVPDNLNLVLDRITMVRITLEFEVRKQVVTISQDVGLRNLNKVANNV